MRCFRLNIRSVVKSLYQVDIHLLVHEYFAFFGLAYSLETDLLGYFSLRLQDNTTLSCGLPISY